MNVDETLDAIESEMTAPQTLASRLVALTIADQAKACGFPPCYRTLGLLAANFSAAGQVEAAAAASWIAVGLREVALSRV